MTTNQLILGDNLEKLKNLDSESVDLIYLDPPFFSNRNYEVIWGDDGEVRSFQDRWAGGIEHYISWLKERVKQMHRVLKPTGSIFLHCDWHANAEIKISILNQIFGDENFRGEIIWQRTNAHNDAKKKLAVLKDTIWYYSKSENMTYYPIFGTLTEKYTGDFYKFDDDDGRGSYSLGDLTNTRPGGYQFEYKGFQPNKNGWRCPIETMQQWDKEGLICFPKTKKGRLRIKRYLSNSKGTLLGDVWTDIMNVQGASKERIGYPTQKPEALLQRIIEMASNEGDLVLDPFVGGGTTVVVADKLKRKWIGIDQSVAAIRVSDLRLKNQQDLYSQPYDLQLRTYNAHELRNMNPFEFETFIIKEFGGVPNPKQRNDFGLDGVMPDNTPIQVKHSDNIGRNVIDNFFAAVQRSDKKLFDKNVAERKPVGYIIAFSFGKGAVEEVARLKLKEDIIIELVTVEKIVPIAKKPAITVIINELSKDAKGVREIEFIASGQSEAGIEFYSWDFNHNSEAGFKADVMIDKEGKQTIKLKAGLHNIAVKVVDNDGLESVEVVKLKVNGVVERAE